MSSPVRVCSAQIAPVWEDPEKTLGKAAPLVQHAAASGASLICFPEQFATGWDPASGRNIQDTGGSIVSGLKRLAREHGISILGSFRQAATPLPRNTAIAIGPDGGILATY